MIADSKKKKKTLSTTEMCQTMWTNDSHVFGTMQGGSTRGELADVLTQAPVPPIIFALDMLLLYSFFGRQSKWAKENRKAALPLYLGCSIFQEPPT